MAIPQNIDLYANVARETASLAPIDVTLLVPQLNSDDKIGAIKELVDLLHAGGYVQDSLAFLQSVLEREALQSTILDDVALPHARCASVNKMGLAMGIARPAIDFPSGDDRGRVDIICLIAVPAQSSDDYLTILSTLARMFSDVDLKTILTDCSSSEDLRTTLLSCFIP